MRSTKATAAVARLNRRAEGRQHYVLVVTGDGRFKLRQQVEGVASELGEPLELDAFVSFVDALGPQTPRRVSKFDAAFARQLVKKTD